jgi:hypothetical protein
MMKKHSAAMVTKESSSPPKIKKNRATVESSIHISAPSCDDGLPGLASARSARASGRQPPENDQRLPA